MVFGGLTAALFLFFSPGSRTQKEADMLPLGTSSGLILSVSEKLDIQPTGDGFRIRPLNFSKMRSPFDLTVELKKTVPKGQWPDSRIVNKETIRYRVEEQSGGSGGAGVTLIAWKPCSRGYILIRHRVQAEEPTPPDHTIAWQVIEAARCRATPKP
jgi:hypothetical protein